jgi:hypothetical protein
MILGLTAIGLGVAAGRAHAQGAAAHQFVLSGLVLAGDGRGTAWLQEPALTQNQPLAFRIGDTIGPYRLTGIFDDRVELQGPGGRLTVPLYGTGGTQPAPAAPAQPTQAQSGPTPHPTVPLYDPSRRAGLRSFLEGLRSSGKK